jgi:hypothetical protein
MFILLGFDHKFLDYFSWRSQEIVYQNVPDKRKAKVHFQKQRWSIPRGHGIWQKTRNVDQNLETLNMKNFGQGLLCQWHKVIPKIPIGPLDIFNIRSEENHQSSIA